MAAGRVSEHPPNFVGKLRGPSEVTEGQQLILECDVTGNPRPAVNWFCDDRPLLVGKGVAISYINNQCRLTVSSMTSAMSGVYMCRLSNPHGKAVDSCPVTVRPPAAAAAAGAATAANGCSRTSVSRHEKQPVSVRTGSELKMDVGAGSKNATFDRTADAAAGRSPAFGQHILKKADGAAHAVSGGKTAVQTVTSQPPPWAGVMHDLKHPPASPSATGAAVRGTTGVAPSLSASMPAAAGSRLSVETVSVSRPTSEPASPGASSSGGRGRIVRGNSGGEQSPATGEPSFQSSIKIQTKQHSAGSPSDQAPHVKSPTFGLANGSLVHVRPGEEVQFVVSAGPSAAAAAVTAGVRKQQNQQPNPAEAAGGGLTAAGLLLLQSRAKAHSVEDLRRAFSKDGGEVANSGTLRLPPGGTAAFASASGGTAAFAPSSSIPSSSAEGVYAARLATGKDGGWSSSGSSSSLAGQPMSRTSQPRAAAASLTASTLSLPIRVDFHGGDGNAYGSSSSSSSRPPSGTSRPVSVVGLPTTADPTLAGSLPSFTAGRGSLRQAANGGSPVELQRQSSTGAPVQQQWQQIRSQQISAELSNADDSGTSGRAGRPSRSAGPTTPLTPTLLQPVPEVKVKAAVQEAATGRAVLESVASATVPVTVRVPMATVLVSDFARPTAVPSDATLLQPQQQRQRRFSSDSADTSESSTSSASSQVGDSRADGTARGAISNRVYADVTADTAAATVTAAPAANIRNATATANFPISSIGCVPASKSNTLGPATKDSRTSVSSQPLLRSTSSDASGSRTGGSSLKTAKLGSSSSAAAVAGDGVKQLANRFSTAVNADCSPAATVSLSASTSAISASAAGHGAGGRASASLTSLSNGVETVAARDKAAGSAAAAIGGSAPALSGQDGGRRRTAGRVSPTAPATPGSTPASSSAVLPRKSGSRRESNGNSRGNGSSIAAAAAAGSPVAAAGTKKASSDAIPTSSPFAVAPTEPPAVAALRASTSKKSAPSAASTASVAPVAEMPCGTSGRGGGQPIVPAGGSKVAAITSKLSQQQPEVVVPSATMEAGLSGPCLSQAVAPSSSATVSAALRKYEKSREPVVAVAAVSELSAAVAVAGGPSGSRSIGRHAAIARTQSGGSDVVTACTPISATGKGEDSLQQKQQQPVLAATEARLAVPSTAVALCPAATASDISDSPEPLTLVQPAVSADCPIAVSMPTAVDVVVAHSSAAAAAAACAPPCPPNKTTAAVVVAPAASSPPSLPPVQGSEPAAAADCRASPAASGSAAVIALQEQTAGARRYTDDVRLTAAVDSSATSSAAAGRPAALRAVSVEVAAVPANTAEVLPSGATQSLQRFEAAKIESEPSTAREHRAAVDDLKRLGATTPAESSSYKGSGDKKIAAAGTSSTATTAAAPSAPASGSDAWWIKRKPGGKVPDLATENVASAAEAPAADPKRQLRHAGGKGAGGSGSSEVAPTRPSSSSAPAAAARALATATAKDSTLSDAAPSRVGGTVGSADTALQLRRQLRQQQQQADRAAQAAAADKSSRHSGVSASGGGRQSSDAVDVARVSTDRGKTVRMSDGAQNSTITADPVRRDSAKPLGLPSAAIAASSLRATVASDAVPAAPPAIVAVAKVTSGHPDEVDTAKAALSSVAYPSARAAASLSPTGSVDLLTGNIGSQSTEKVAASSSEVATAPLGAAAAPIGAVAAPIGAVAAPIGAAADAPSASSAAPPMDGASISGAVAVGAPKFVIRPRTQYVKKGQTATLRCLADGQPKPTVGWQHFGKMLTPSAKYKMYVKNDFSCLDVISADAADHGEYICIISNAVGSVQSTVELDVSGVVHTASPSVAPLAASAAATTSKPAAATAVAHGPGIGIDATGLQRTVIVPVEPRSNSTTMAVIAATAAPLPSSEPDVAPLSPSVMSQDKTSLDGSDEVGLQRSKLATASDLGNAETGSAQPVAECSVPSAAASAPQGRSSLGSRLQLLSEHYSVDVATDDAARASKPTVQRPPTAGSSEYISDAVAGDSVGATLSTQQLSLRRKLDALGSDALVFAAELDARGAAAKERRSERAAAAAAAAADLPTVGRRQIADSDLKARGERAGPDGCEAGSSGGGGKIFLTDAVADESSVDDVFASLPPQHSLPSVSQAVGVAGSGNDGRPTTAAAPPFRAPRFTKLLENQELTEGDSVTIECVKSPGSSVSTVTAAQQRDGNDDEDAGAADAVQDLDSDLRSLDLSGEGGVGSSLDVTCVPGAGEEDAADCPPDTPPTFVRTLIDSAVVEGQAVELVAEVFGTEPIDIVWVHNDEELSTDNPDYHLLREGRLCRLLITDVFVEDAGTYICEAYNKFGDCDTACSLTVRAKGGAEPPSFLCPLPATLSVVEGSTVSLCCRISNVDPLDVTWSKNGRMARQGQRFKVSGESDSFSYEIQHVLSTDAGTYEVNAANDYGTVSCQCSVTVSSATPTEETDVKELLRQKRLERAVLMSASRPRFLEILQDVEVAEGKGLSLSCRVDGSPAPDVQWYIDGREVKESANVMLSYENKLAQLEIRETTASEHQGRYTCVATNKEGQEKTTGSVAIRKAKNAYVVPNPPVGKPFVTDVTSQAMTVAWYGPDFDGGTSVICYKVEMCKLSLLKISQDKFWKTLTDQCKHTSYRVTSLVADAEYVFRVRAINSVGESAPSEWSESAIATDRRLSSLSDSESQFETESLYSEYSEYSEYAESEYDYDLDEAFSDHVAEIRKDVAFDDQYDIKTLLGKGKFGAVYLCTEKSTGREWAAKRIKCRPSQKSEIMNEIDIMNDLRHPKLVRLWEVFEGSKEMVLVTEYVSGGELFERIAGDDFDLTETDCVRFTKQICDGVQYMHEKCILHLDLKPENIICTKRESNQIKLIDFGLARRYKNGESMKVMFGTPEFVAPEVINFEPIDFATDMWSIGVITYVLLSGLSPFCGDTDSETLSNVTKAQWEFDEDAFADISLCAKDFVTKLLVKRKEHRMSAADCCRHMWLADSKPQRTRKLRKSKEKMKKFVARRKWQKTGNAIRALSRIRASLQGPSGHYSGSSSQCDLASPSPATAAAAVPSPGVTRELDAGSSSASARKQAAQGDGKNAGSVGNGGEGAKANGKGPHSRVEQQKQPGVVGGHHGRHFKSDDSGYEGANLGAYAGAAAAAAAAVASPSGQVGRSGTALAADADHQKTTGYEDEPVEPAFVRPLVDTSVVEGVGVCISCEVQPGGGPALTVAWFKDGAQLPPAGDGYRCLSDGCRLSLIIDKAKVTDDAEYECRVSNDAGEASSFAELYVTSAASS